MKHRSCMFIGILLGCLSANCNTDDTNLHSGTRCHATYVLIDSSNKCYFGECQYDPFLRDHYCPADAPLCIKDEKGYFYCGASCPEGSIPNNTSEEFASMCRCDLEQCLNAKSHEGWLSAECTEDNQCKALECQNDYTLHNGNCFTPLKCCGDECNACDESEGWESGSCQNGKCIAEKCRIGYHLTEDKNGNVYCLNNSSHTCDNSDPICPPNYVCNPDTFVCECAPELNECNYDCYDLQSDTDHCGNCETACQITNAENQCIAGECQFVCNAGYIKSEDGKSCIQDITCSETTTNCNGTCINLSSDMHNCGSCGNECNAGQCIDGTCQCPDQKTNCSNTCVDLSSDPNNCGECGTVCSGGKSCIESKCQCPLGMVECSGICVELNTNAHCANCEDVCSGGKTCQDKKCQCPSEMAECSGICVELNTNEHCANCEDVCSGGKTCQDKKCQCPLEMAECNGICVELNTNEHCANCEDACSGGMTCQNKKCQCPPGQTDCGGKCVDTNSDSNHCGKCNNVCNGKCIDSICLCEANEISCHNTCISSYQMGVVIARPSVPCNDAPDNSANKLDDLNYGKSVAIYAIENEWFVTQWNHQKAYIDSQYVFMMPTRGHITANNGIKLYKESNKSDAYETLEKDTSVTISDFKLDGTDLWFQISEPKSGFTNESSYISRDNTNGDDRHNLPNCSK